jgi:ketosteroid isomerase-like protein
MKTLLLVPVVGLAISFALPTFAQQKEPTLSEQEQAEKTAVDHALRDYNDAFGRGDLSAIGQHCNVPFVSIFPEGVGVKVLATMSEIEAGYGGYLKGLRERGYSHSIPSELHVKLLDQITALASGVFVRQKTDGSELETIGGTYVLRKTEGEWKISVVIRHLPANVIRAF